MANYRYFLSIQTLLPDNYRNNRDFIDNMKTLQEEGFDGVELNIRDPFSIDPADLKSFLGDFGLQLAMFASGATAKGMGLSLASTDDKQRSESVRQSIAFLEFASRFGAGVIAGFLKGPLEHRSPENREKLRQSVSELAPHALRLKTPLLLEAINRFESPLGNSLDDTFDLIGKAANPYTWILPDTWHMNIEETSMAGAMMKHREHFGSFHLSENNRFFPGYGALDFKQIIEVLDACGYTGKLAIEGNIKKSFREDVQHSMRFLKPLLEK